MNRLKIAAALLPFFFACASYEPEVPAGQTHKGLLSVPLGDQDFGEYHVAAVYYPIRGNVDDTNSSVFVSDAPSPDQTLTFSMNAPAYSWTIYRGLSEIKTITLTEHLDGRKSHWAWFVVDEWHRTSQEFPARFAGQLTEHRFKELTNPDSLYSADLLDADVEISDPFGDAVYTVVPYKRIRNRLDDFISGQRLYDPNADIRNVQPNFEYGSQNMGPVEPTQPGTPAAALAPVHAAASGSSAQSSSPVQAPVKKPSAPADSFFVKGGTLDSISHACLANLYGNQTLMTRNHVHCRIDETIRMKEPGGLAVSPERQFSYDLPVLPCRKHDFAVALFPGVQPSDTFSLIDENGQSITFAIASSNPVFREYLSEVVLHFDRSTAALVEFSATTLPPKQEVGREKWIGLESANPVPLTIRYKQQGDLILPFVSSFTQEVKREGKAAIMIHEMVYRY